MGGTAAAVPPAAFEVNIHLTIHAKYTATLEENHKIQRVFVGNI